MLQSSTSLRKHINSFLKHVHPDLFHEETECERTNLESLQKLHCFIDEVKQFENGASHGAIPRFLELKFYVKANPQAAYDKLPPPITAKFTIPSELFEMRDRAAQKRAIVASAVRQVIDLLRKAGVDVPAGQELGSMPEPFEAPVAAAPTQRVRPGWVSDVASDMNDAFYDALRQYRDNIVTEERYAGTKLYDRMIQRAELTSLFNPANVYFHPKLTLEQQQQGLRRLKGNLSRLGFEQWANLPIFMTVDEWSASAHRALVIPYNFSLREMKLYLMNELPRITEEKKRFETALSNALDLSDNLVDTLPVRKVSITGDLHPADACDILRSLTQLIRAKHLGPDHDEDLAIALEHTHLVLTRHVAEAEVRSTPDAFMVLVPRNFNGYELLSKITTEYQAWTQRARQTEGATETMHDSGELQAYTTAMQLPIDALTKNVPVGASGEREKTAIELAEEGLSEAEKQERQRQRTLTAMFTTYLKARTMSDKPVLSGWVSALADAKPEEDHTLWEMKAVSASLLPLNALVDLQGSPVAGLGKASAVPAASVAALSSDAELVAKFGTFVEQLQNFAVVLRDEVPRLVNALPRSAETAQLRVPANAGETVARKLMEGVMKDDAVYGTNLEEEDMRMAAEAQEADKEEGEGGEGGDKLEEIQEGMAGAQREEAEEDEALMADEDEEGELGEEGEEGEAEGARDEEMPESFNPNDQTGEGGVQAKAKAASTLPDFPNSRVVDADLEHTLHALNQLAEALPEESPIGQLVNSMNRSMVKALELAELDERFEEEAPELAVPFVKDRKGDEEGALDADERDDDAALRDEDEDEADDEAEGAAVKAGPKDAVAAPERKGEAAEEDEEEDEGDEVDKVMRAQYGRKRVLGDGEEELEELARGEEGDEGEGGAVAGAEDAEVDEEGNFVPADSARFMQLIKIRDVMQNVLVRKAFKDTLQLAYTSSGSELFRNALLAVGRAHADLDAAIEKKLKGAKARK